MPPIIETGHVINSGNFEKLIITCTSQGAVFNPSNNRIKLPALNTKHGDAVAALTAVSDKFADWVKKVNKRNEVFEPLELLITRIIGAVASSGASKLFLGDVKTLGRKLQGQRASKKKATVPDNPQTPENESQKSISASQLSFNSRIGNFERLIALLLTEPLYIPNEADLTTASLTTYHGQMVGINTEVIEAYTDLTNARDARDKVLYEPETGLVDLALEVKQYVKSLGGTKTDFYQNIVGLKFRRSRSK